MTTRLIICDHCGRDRPVDADIERLAARCSVCTWEPVLADPAEPWQDDALCAQVGSELFFVEKGGSTAEAKKVCSMCPVRPECLEAALRNEEPHGIWGGTSPRERERILVNRQQVAS